MSLPNLASPSGSSFHLKKESIEDLYFDHQTDPVAEYSKLTKVLNSSKNKSTLEREYLKSSMDREGFSKFVELSSGIESNVANEIFSCVTDLFVDESEEDCLELPDKVMSRSEFAAAVVRLANLWFMMNEGMADASKLSMQTAAFIAQIP